MRLSIRIVLIVTGVAIMTLVAAQAVQSAGAGSTKPKITRFPEKLNKACRRGRAKLFDECGDQWAMFNAARKRAAAEGKALLVSFGAEWCIWCHVFDQYIHGGKTRFSYTFGSAPVGNPSRACKTRCHRRCESTQKFRGPVVCSRPYRWPVCSERLCGAGADRGRPALRACPALHLYSRCAWAICCKTRIKPYRDPARRLVGLVPRLQPKRSDG